MNKIWNCFLPMLTMLLVMFMLLLVAPLWGMTGDLELSPYMIGGKKGNTAVQINNGHGLMLNAHFLELKYGDLGLFTSLDMRGVDLLGHSAGNLNTVMFGPSYKTPSFWKKCNVSLGGGYANAHDSDMQYATTSIIKKATFNNGYGLWGTFDLNHEITNRQILGLKIGARYVKMDVEAKEVYMDAGGVTRSDLDADLEPLSYLAMLEWKIKF